MVSQTNQHVFATVRAFEVEAGFMPSGTGVMQCYVVTVGGMSKPTDTLDQARAFVRWHETQEGEPGENEQYSIVRVSWDMAALAREEHGFVHDPGVQTVEQIESGVVYYAAASAAAQQEIANMKYAYVVVGQDVLGLGDTAELALADAALYVEGGMAEVRQRLSFSIENIDDGRAVITPVAEARRYCKGGESGILAQLGL